MSFKESLLSWANMFKLAENNPDLLIANYSQNVDECVRRMKVLSDLWSVLESYPDNEINQEMRDFRKVDNDKGCTSCWLSASGPKHPHCDKKIKNWFKAREMLVESAKITEGNTDGL